MKNQEPKRQAKLTPQQVDHCLLHMLRSPVLFAQARGQLAPDDFDRGSEMRWALVWSAALAVAERAGGELPCAGLQQIIKLEIDAKVERAGGGQVVPEAVASARQLVDWIFDYPEPSLNVEYYRSFVRELIIERKIVAGLAVETAQAMRLGRTVDLPRKLQESAQRIKSVMADPSKAAKTAFPLGIKPTPITKFETGIKYLDAMLGGGQAGGEVYALLGPTGLGKTTMGVMIAVQTARYWADAYNEGRCKKKKISYLISWEQEYLRIAHRVWSYAAKIDSGSLERYCMETNPEPLSTAGKLKPYEMENLKREAKELGAATPGEEERLVAATAQLQDYIRIGDFSGYDEANPTAGQNGIDDVVDLIKTVNGDEFETGVIILDYAGIAVRRMISAHNLKMDNMRQYLAEWGDKCRFNLATPFNAPVWAIHQLNPAANRRSSTAEQHHSSAAECGSFADNMWFAFSFGVKEEINKQYYTKLWCTKSRRTKGDAPSPLLRIDGQFCEMVDVSDRFTIDAMTNRFVPREVADSYQRANIRRPQRIEEARAGFDL